MVCVVYVVCGAKCVALDFFHVPEVYQSASGTPRGETEAQAVGWTKTQLASARRGVGLAHDPKSHQHLYRDLWKNKSTASTDWMADRSHAKKGNTTQTPLISAR